MQKLSLFLGCLFALLLLGFALNYPLYKFLLPLPGAVTLALGGSAAALVIGFAMGRRFKGLGVTVIGWASLSMSLPLTILYVLTATPSEKFAILSGLGYFSIPFFGLAGGLLALRGSVKGEAGSGV